jgi:hypothetical protein
MKNILFALFLTLISIPAVSAQTTNKTVEKIRAYYNEISEKARLAETDDDQGQYGGLFVNELAINSRSHQWRAVGIYQPVYKFFYKTTGESMYPETLVMIKTARKVSDRSYLEEYVYDEKRALLFYFQKAENDAQTPAERRVYFAMGKAFLIVEGDRSRDKPYVTDAATVNEIIAQSEKLRDMFLRSLKL